MKILFVWRKIDQVAGGVERMITTMMNEMIKRGHEVSLLTWDKADATPYYHMDDQINWYKLNLGDPSEKAGILLRLKRAPKVRKIIKVDKPDVIICFESGVFLSTKIFLTGFKVPLIAAERNAPSRLDFSDTKKKKRIFQILKLADTVTVQFERYREWYPENLRNKIVAINNPVAPASFFASPSGNGKETKILLTVLRLAYQKNTNVLIKSFAKISEKFPDWKLIVAGSGEDEAKIIKLVSALDINDRVTLMGDVKDVKPLYKDAHLFCLASRWEGFPNALAEAMSHGLPAVGFAECSGISDLIQEGITGLLAQGNDNETSLAKALDTLMSNHQKRELMGVNAIKHIEQYKPELIFDQWESLFFDTSTKSNKRWFGRF